MTSFASLRQAVYEAALLPSAAPALMEKLRVATQADVVAFHAQDLRDNISTTGVVAGIDPLVMQTYEQHFAGDNILFERGEPLLVSGAIKCVGEILPEREFHASRYYNELFRAFDLHHCLGACVLRESSILSVLSLLRSHRHNDFDDAPRRLLQRLTPHLQRAVLVRRELGVRDLATVAAWEALEQSGLALVTLDAAGRATLVTGAARRLCDRADGLRVTIDGLRAVDTAADCALQRAQALARFGDAPIPILTVPRSTGKPYRVLVVGVGRVDTIESGPSVLVMIRAPDVHVPPHLGLLRELFGLTSAEARLVHTLTSGDTLQDHANRTGTRVHTVRSQLLSIFDKTDTASQATLCRLVARAATGAAD